MIINITEEVLMDLGFQRNDVSAEESGGSAFHYFNLDKNGECLLISCGNDETINGQYYTVEIFNGSEFGYIVNKQHLREFINSVNKFVQKI